MALAHIGVSVNPSNDFLASEFLQIISSVARTVLSFGLFAERPDPGR
jgi:hypothetical protein